MHRNVAVSSNEQGDTTERLVPQQRLREKMSTKTSASEQQRTIMGKDELILKF